MTGPLYKLEPELLGNGTKKVKFTFSAVAPSWKGQTFCCIAGGASLSQGQVDLVRDAGIKTIAINDAYLLAPWADICFFADFEWWGWQTNGIAKPGFTAEQVRERFASFVGQKCSVSNSGSGITDPAVHFLKTSGDLGLSLDPRSLYTGRNSGWMAINLAVHAGGKTGLLLGYDLHGVPGKSHWFGEHPRKPVAQEVYDKYRMAFAMGENPLKNAGVRIINCTPGSMLNSFEKMDLAAALQQLLRAVA